MPNSREQDASLFRQLFLSFNEPVCLVEDDKVVCANDPFSHLVNTPPEDFEGENIANLFSGWNEDKWNNACRTAHGKAESQAAFSLKSNIKDSISSRVTFTLSPITGSDDTTYLLIRISRRPQVEPIIENDDINERLNQVLEATNDALWEWNIATDKVLVSNQWYEITGFTSSEIEQKIVPEELIHQDDIEETRITLENHLSGYSPQYEAEYRIRHKDGRWLWILDRGKVVERSENGVAKRMVGTWSDITSRRMMAERLVQARREWERTFNSVPDLILILDNDFKILNVNSAVLEKLDVRGGDLLGGDCRELLTSEEEKNCFCPQKVKVENGSVLVSEVYSKLFKGDYQVCTSCFHDSMGEPAGIVHVARDISERKEMERKLEASEARYRGIVELQVDLIVRVDLEGKITFVNKAFCNMFGRAEADLLGDRMAPLYQHRDASEIMRLFEFLKRPPHRKREEQLTLTVHGWRWLQWEYFAVFGEAGEVVEIQGVARDITDRMTAEERLIRSEERFRNLFEQSNDAIYVRQDDQLLLVNGSFERLFGLSGSKICSESFRFQELFYSDILSGSKLVTMTPEDAEILLNQNEIVGKTSDGNYLYLRVTTSVLSWDSGRAVLGVLRDVTGEKEIQDRQMQTKRLETANQIAATIAHEFNQPLAILRIIADLAFLDNLDEKEKRRHLEGILPQVERMQQLVKKLLKLKEFREIDYAGGMKILDLHRAFGADD